MEAAGISTVAGVAAVFGLSAGFSPGPLMALVIAQTLRYGVREGILAASAPVLTDAPIIIISFLVLSKLSTVGPVIGMISALGGFYVLYLSYETFKIGPVKIETSVVQPRSLKKGVLVNALNPHPYLFWVTVGAPFILKIQQNEPIAPWVFILSFYCLLIGSKVILSLIVGNFRTFLEGAIYLYVMRSLGAVLAVFAVFLLWDSLVHFGLIYS